MLSQIHQLHNLVLNMIHFCFSELMGTDVECGSVSLLALLVHLHISPWEWQHRDQPDVIIHRLECTQPHSTPILQIYFASRETCCIYSMDVRVCWHGQRIVSAVSLDMGSVLSVWMGGMWIALLPNKQHVGGESKRLTLRASLKSVWCNPVTLHTHTDWWENVWRRLWYGF